MKWRIVLLVALSAATPGFAAEGAPTALPMDVPALREQAKEAGIEHVYEGPWEYFVGGGVAAFDCNGDRFPDLAFAGGTNDAALYVNHSRPGEELRFAQAEEALPKEARDKVTGLYPLDIDGDGNKDLIVLRVGENVILKGDGACHFEKTNRNFSFDGGRAWTTAFAATFEQDGRFPTLAFGNYVDRSAPGSPFGTCHDNVLIRPREAADGTPDYSDPQTMTPGYCALSMLFTDWNGSGVPALRITNDRQYYRGGQEELWRVDPGRPARPYRSTDGWQAVTIWGMGIAETDLDADGKPEYALTSMGDTKLQTLDEEAEEDRPVYRDIAVEKGTTAHRPYTGDDIKPSTGWHAEFADMNNDGRTDLFIAKGNVQQMPDFARFDPDNLLLGTFDGRFVEAGEPAGLARATRGRGGAVVDLNMDGMLDLVVVNRQAPVALFRNGGAMRDDGRSPSPMGSWIAVELHQDGPNPDAIGAVISVRLGNETVTRRISVGGGHASGHLGFVHVGTGTAERAEIRVKWPDGDWSAPYRVFAGNFIRIDRQTDHARYWYPIRIDEKQKTGDQSASLAAEKHP
ncbi:CRTAC1 family protein [Notoacmeibacter ruber]|uniref:CRTAC1 family protein n=1 Tax=Notoacmeibacter ruber TaxID=2670375 RepID=A0A3L7J9I5_9HYPH|nr:CRTAC1 family protein [Notoacmeibacter ruber]RLQ87139.1 CRTAC1 family protein [Notoacmeibacter ruber]